MIKYHDKGFIYKNGSAVPAGNISAEEREVGIRKTIAHQILSAHQIGERAKDGGFNIRFDGIASHDITYVSIIQTLRASRPDLKSFPLPYMLSNCHNTLCAVGGTINSDDHAFGLSAAKKYGGIFVPPHMAVIHQYAREKMAGCGKMILGSDSHTRYGAIGTMGIGEGGGELVKQLLEHTYDVPRPQVVGVCLTGEPLPWAGPQDVALALIGKVFGDGLVKNKVLEFFGDGVGKLSMDFRNGVDVMTTETACLSSVWITDGKTEEFLALHKRAGDYKKLSPEEGAYYDALIEIDLSTVKPMIALPFHPSNAYEIEGLDVSQIEASGFPLKDKLTDGRLCFEQGIITGCAGGLYENIRAAAAILENATVGSGPFTLSVYPASQPVYMACVENGLAGKLMRSGAVLRTAFCGPCFGAGEVPPNGGLSARHATRNFPNREGSKPPHQTAGVALMDARSIAATAANHGILTAASEENYRKPDAKPYFFDASAYAATVYEGYGKPDGNAELITGPGIRDWPKMPKLAEHLMLAVASVINDPVTTTDELIPSGETSSYRSNPMALAEFTLSRKDPGYVERAKKANGVNENALKKLSGGGLLADSKAASADAIGWGSMIYAKRPGDGSAREQAASCQRVLGGVVNIAQGYATKRYRSNLINWGMLPFTMDGEAPFETGDYIFIPNVRKAVADGTEKIKAYAVRENEIVPMELTLNGLTADEKEIILQGGLINYYGSR